MGEHIQITVMNVEKITLNIRRENNYTQKWIIQTIMELILRKDENTLD